MGEVGLFIVNIGTKQGRNNFQGMIVQQTVLTKAFTTFSNKTRFKRPLGRININENNITK